jgi:uncharacterized RDD family membrane protein YckC
VKLAPVEQPPNGRDVVLGLVVSVGRLGAATGRLALSPAQAVARTSLRGPLRARAEELAATGQSAGVDARRRLELVAGEVLAAPEAERTLDGVLAGPLPEAVARSLVEHRVVERVVDEVLESADLEAAIVAALEREQTGQLVHEVLASEALERLVVEAVDSRLTLEVSDRVVRSDAFRNVLAQVLSSPEVRTALTRQTTGLAEEMTAAARRRAVSADATIESPPRRWLHRPPRPRSETGEPAPVVYAGLASRGLALAIDALLANLLFLSGTALVGLVTSLVGSIRPTWLAATLVSAGWILVVSAYFTCFWATAGQTPGMRLLRLRLLAGDGTPPGLGRSLLRLAGLLLAIVLLFTGFLPALVDDRRRALQDYLAGTVVYYDEHAPVTAASPTGDGR